MSPAVQIRLLGEFSVAVDDVAVGGAAAAPAAAPKRNWMGPLAGLAAGSIALAVVAWWLLRISKRLPIARFFGLSSLLIAVLAVVLVGKGVAALQEAGWIAQSFVAGPRIDWIGVYPTWQSLLAQLAVAVLAWTAFSANARASRIQQRAHEPLQLKSTALPMPPS